MQSKWRSRRVCSASSPLATAVVSTSPHRRSARRSPARCVVVFHDQQRLTPAPRTPRSRRTLRRGPPSRPVSAPWQRAEAQAAARRLVAGDDVHRDVSRVAVLEAVEHRPAFHVGQLDVERDRVGPDSVRRARAGFAACRDDALKPLSRAMSRRMRAKFMSSSMMSTVRSPALIVAIIRNLRSSMITCGRQPSAGGVPLPGDDAPVVYSR